MIACPPAARDKVFGQLALSLATFDKRFEKRELEVIEGPEERDEGGSVWMRWRVTYTSPGAPPLVMEGEETAHYEGDRISRLVDRFAPNTAKEVLAWMAANADRLSS